MTPQRRRRLYMVLFIVLGVGAAAALAATAFRENLLFFFSPSQIASGEAPVGETFRVGGLVVPGSVQREEDGVAVRFVLTDNAHEVTVHYEGILPDLFREGQGIVAKGRLTESGVFRAQEVLAKHDEEYMPPEVADSLVEGDAKNPHADEPAGAGYEVEP